MPWRWDRHLAASFENHIASSVPLYKEGHRLILEVSDWWAHHGATILDLGCSTGLLTDALAERHPSARVIGIDSEPEMLNQARQRGPGRANLTYIDGDATETDLGTPDFIVGYYVAQFLDPAARARLIARVYSALAPGGAFVLFEKTLPTSANGQNRAASALHSFKVRHGIDPREVLAKDRALRGVLRPRTSAQITTELQEAGFADVETIMRWLQFAGFLAIKAER